MNLIDTKYFQLYYDEKDSNVVKCITSLIDADYDKVIDYFQIEKGTEKYHFFLCPDVEAYLRYTNKCKDEYEDWMVGNASYENRTLCILSPNVVKDRSFEDMLKVICHEIVHIAMDSIMNPDEAGIMISEGIAVAFANQIQVQNLQLNHYPLIKFMDDEEYFYNNDGYNYSGAYVLFLLKKYGIEVFKNIYSGKDNLGKYLYDGFETDAISNVSI